MPVVHPAVFVKRVIIGIVVLRFLDAHSEEHFQSDLRSRVDEIGESVRLQACLLERVAHPLAWSVRPGIA
jgi:hypothetical protein